jgi:phosphatidate cytidylyltransferase
MLKARVLTALVLLGVFLLALFLLPALGWTLFVTLAMGVAAWEWAGFGGCTRRGRIAYGAACAVLTALAGVWLTAAFGQAPLDPALLPIHFLAGAFWLALVPLWLARGWRLGAVPVTLGVGWLVLLPAAVALMQLRAFSPAAVLFAMAGVWVADIAAYFSGRRFGRRKLAPLISPGKTWEGVGGAVVAVTLYGLAVLAGVGALAGQSVAAVVAVVGGLVVLTGVSVLGDLFESLLKRQAGLKDSGKLLPGHGGVLDRIDSLTSTLPVVVLALSLWNK